jgi:hypothetical protein
METGLMSADLFVVGNFKGKKAGKFRAGGIKTIQVWNFKK